MKKIFFVIVLLSAAYALYAQDQNAGRNALEAYNQTHIYNWSSMYPDYELKYLLNKTKAYEEALTYTEEKQKKESEQPYEYYANKTVYNPPGSDVNPLRYNWYYQPQYTLRYNPLSGELTPQSQGSNLTYNPYTQKWDYPQ